MLDSCFLEHKKSTHDAHEQDTQDVPERRTPEDISPKVRAPPPSAPTAEPRRLRPSSPFSC